MWSTKHAVEVVFKYLESFVFSKLGEKIESDKILLPVQSAGRMRRSLVQVRDKDGR